MLKCTASIRSDHKSFEERLCPEALLSLWRNDLHKPPEHLKSLKSFQEHLLSLNYDCIVLYCIICFEITEL